ncbi:hypothetical protein ANTPLA_LOCUS10162 [Anthophora plagiata]
MLRINFLWLLVISSVSTENIISIDQSVAPTKYCRNKERLITSEENDEYLLISAEIDTIVVMECRFCNDKKEGETKIWYYQDRYRENPEKVIELGMDNNISYNRIYTTPELSLVVKEFALADAGVYLCHGAEGQEVSQMSELAEIREVGITLQVISEWAPWSLCEHCVRNRGYKTSLGNCRLKRHINTTIADKSDSSIVKFFRKFPLIPCKSILLEEEFPAISSAVRYLPEYILKEPCKKCPHVKKKKGRKFKYVKRFVLAEGAYLTVVCPESTKDTQVSWKKDSITLEKGVRRSFRKLDPEARVIVDAFGLLYLIDVSAHEEGNYTCYIDNIGMMQLKVIVILKARLLTQGDDLKGSQVKGDSGRDDYMEYVSVSYSHSLVSKWLSLIILVPVWQFTNKNISTKIKVNRKRSNNRMSLRRKIVVVATIVSLVLLQSTTGLLRRCVNCRSRGDLGSCKDPFTMNSTAIEMEKGVDAVPCASGWCGKIIERHGLNNEYGTATQRLCFQRGPDDGEERCAYTVWNYKKVYMCLCFGDLCNGSTRPAISNGLMFTMFCILIRWFV